MIQELATIPSLVAKKWCIEEGRVDLTGHSDGGMAADANAYRGLKAPQLVVEHAQPPAR